MRVLQAQLGPQGLGTTKDVTEVKASQSFQNRELFPEGPPQWDALIGSSGSRRVNLGEEKALTN